MYIYLTENLINGKKYIGCCSKSEEKSKSYLGSGIYLNKAIKKYGKENFKKKILEVCNSYDQLKKAEFNWISKFNADKSKYFYNAEPGGGNCFWNSISEDKKNKIKKKISQSTKLAHLKNDPEVYKKRGRSFSLNLERTQFKYFETLLNSNLLSYKLHLKLKRKKNYNRWIKNNCDAQEYIKKIKKEQYLNSRSKIIYQFDLDGNLLQKYKCLNDIILKYGGSKGSLNSSINGTKNSWKKYRWSYKEIPNDIIKKKRKKELVKRGKQIHPSNHINIKCYKVIQKDLNNNKLKEFENKLEIEKTLNFSRNMIRRAINKKIPYKGYLWENGELIIKTIYK